jgi:hypothetical protein
VLETEGLRYAPDVVLAQLFLTNDLDDIRYERHFAWPKPHFELVGDRLEYFPAHRTWDVRLRESSYLGELVFRAVDGWLPRSVHALRLAEADTVPLLVALCVRMEAVAKGCGAKLLVVIVVAPERAVSERPERELRTRDLLIDAGLTVLDLHAAFEPHIADPTKLFVGGIGHCNAAGHELAASEIARELEARGWLL